MLDSFLDSLSYHVRINYSMSRGSLLFQDILQKVVFTAEQFFVDGVVTIAGQHIARGFLKYRPSSLRESVHCSFQTQNSSFSLVLCHSRLPTFQIL